MAEKLRFPILLSGLVLGAALSGCSGAGLGAGPEAASRIDRAETGAMAGAAMLSAGGRPQPERAQQGADKARAALAAGKAADAVGWAEVAVAADPRHGGHRALLGQAYMQDGRFSAAAAALGEAADLGAVSGDAVVALALAKIAEGDARGAVEWLSNNAEGLTASDLGLALSLAGDHQGAQYVLGNAVRQGDVTAQTRQNYALALALGGRWAQARLMAAQDLALDRVEKRMLEFSAIASAADKKVQIASLMGTKLRADAGMPVQLALSNFPVEKAMETCAGAMMALADGPELAGAAVVTDFAVSADAVAPVVPVPVPVPEPVPVPVPVSIPILVHGPEPLPVGVMMAAFDTDVPGRAGVDTGRWSVQVGALDSVEKARMAWQNLSASSAVAARYAASTRAAQVGERTYYRLTLDGLSSRRDAQLLCATLQAERKDCFVRKADEQTRPLWAVRAHKMQLALR